MKIEGRILTNAVILGSGELVGQLANFAFVIAFARQFGAEVLGAYSLAMSVGASICIFVSLGVHSLLARQIGQEPARGQAAIGHWLPFELGSALAVWTTIALVAWLLPVSPELSTFLLTVGAYQIIWRIGTLFSLQFSSRGLMVIPSFFNGFHRLVILILAGTAMALHAEASVALLAFPLVAVPCVGLLAWRARRAFGALEVRLNVATAASLISRARSFFLMSVMGVVQGRIGIILLAVVAGNTVVGMYAAADRLLLPVILLEMLLIKAAYPALLRLWVDDRARMQEVSARCLRFVLFLSIPLSGLMFAFRTELVAVVYGPQFESAVAPLAVLAWLPVLAGMRTLWGTHAVTAHLQKEAAISKAIAITVLITGALLLIRQHGAVGLAIVVVGAEAVHAALLFAVLARHGMVPRVAGPSLGPLCAVMFAILASGTVVDEGIALRFGVVGGVMLLGLWLFGGIRMHDVRFVADALYKQGRPS